MDPCATCGFIKTDNNAPVQPRVVLALGPDHLLRHNDPPIDSEIPEIQQFLTNAKTRLDYLNSILAPLIWERDKITADLRSHAAIVSAMRRCPTEVLCRIFEMTLPPLAHLELPESPWYLGHISRRWRDIAIALSSLWSSIGVHGESEESSKRFPLELERFQEQFRRAGAAALHITIPGQARVPFSGPLQTVLEASNRWETLSIRSTTDLPELDLPRLRRVYCGNPARWSKYSDQQPSAYEVLDSSAGLWAQVGSGGTLSSSFPWRHLTRYDGFVDWYYHLELLREAPQLVECRISFLTQCPAEARTDDIVSVPHLRRLCVSTASCLANIEAPGLQELGVDFNGALVDGSTRQDDEPAQILAFLERSACTLLRLSLLKWDQMSSTLPILLATPSLRELIIERAAHGGRNDSDAHTAGMINNLFPRDPGSDTPPLLPNLTAISFGDMGRDFPRKSTVDMIAARFNSPDERYRQIVFFGMLIDTGSIRAETKFPRRSETFKRLHRLQKAGLEVCRVKARERYNTMRVSDTFSVQRCARYVAAGITSNRIWD
ncbi:hypothetical protein C8R43DRAFT_1032079 [Mycena crocata]|nr:hypothetical protein C8R43DRAFT_1032079 [Mycena crocata]